MPSLSKSKKIVFIFIFAIFLIFLALTQNYLSERLLQTQVINAKKYPRFGITGTDPKKLREETQKLEQSVENLAGIFNTEYERSEIRNSLHPIDFLLSLANLEQKRIEFIKHRSIKNFISYRFFLWNTARIYQKDLKKYKDSLGSLHGITGKEVFDYYSGSLPINTLKKNVEFMIANSKLSGSVINRTNEWENSSNASLELTDVEKEDDEFTRKIISERGWKILTPLIEIPTQCGRESGRSFYYLIDRGGYLVSIGIDQAFYNFHRFEADSGGFYKKLSDAGYDHIWQSNFNYYFCPDQTYHAEILTTYKIMQLAAELPEFPGRDEFLNSEILWRGQLIKFFQEIENLKDPRSGAIVEEIKLLVQQRSAYFEEIVRYGVFLNENYIERLEKIGRAQSYFISTFVTRSYPTIYFLTFNRSVWLPDVELNFFSDNRQAEMWTNRRELIKKYSKEELVKIVLLSSEWR